ncbi:MAG: dTMP kinase [Pseudomonadota bacterium]
MKAAATMGADRFVTFEGGEGAGKSTQVARLAERLRADGAEVIVTREPGGAPFAERIRKVLLTPADRAPSPLAEALAFYSARADHLAQTIGPALSRGAWVLCDRFNDSTRAYQGAAGGVADAHLDRLDEIVVGDTRPGLTFLIDIPPEEGLARAKARRAEASADMFEARELAFHTALRDAYLAIAAAEPARCRVVDGARAPDAVADEIWDAIAAHRQSATAAEG